MAVIEDLQLPNQPSSGCTKMQPLGGNGFNAPINQYYVEATVTGDASGGSIRLNCRFDPKFLGLVHWANLQVNGATAATNVRVNNIFAPGGDGANYSETLVGVFDQQTGSSRSVWRPPPVVNPPRPAALATEPPMLQIDTENGDGKALAVRMMIFSYMPEAAQVTPWPLIAAAFAS